MFPVQLTHASTHECCWTGLPTLVSQHAHPDLEDKLVVILALQFLLRAVEEALSLGKAAAQAEGIATDYAILQGFTDAHGFGMMQR